MNVEQEGGELIQQGVNGCIFHPTLTCKKPKISDKNINYVTKIQEMNWISMNEEKIGHRILKVKNYRNYFAPVSKTCPIKNINQQELKKHYHEKDKYGELCNLFNYNLNMLTLQYIPYVKNAEFKNMFFHRMKDKNLKRRKTSDIVIKRFFKGYLHLLNAMGNLNDKNIIHNDLHQYNIVYDTELKLPIILDFGYSLDSSAFKPTYDMDTFINKNKKMVSNLFRFKNLITIDFHYPWDEVVLHEFVKHSFKNKKNNNYVNEFTIVELLDTVKADIDENIYSCFAGFSNDFINQYKTLLLEYIDSFKTKTPNQAYKELIKYKISWNNFVLSMVFIRMIKYIFKDDIPINGKKNKYFAEFIKILLLNVHPYPKRRLGFNDTKTKVMNLYKKAYKNSKKK